MDVRQRAAADRTASRRRRAGGRRNSRLRNVGPFPSDGRQAATGHIDRSASTEAASGANER